MKTDWRDEATLLRRLIDLIPNCFIFVKDAQSRFITTNAAHLKALGLESLDQVVGRTDFDFFPKGLAEQYYADEQQIITTGEPVLDREEETVDSAGNRTWVLTSKVPLSTEDGVVVGVIGMSRDITRLKRLEDDLKTLTAEKMRFSIIDGLTGAFNRRFLSEDLPIILDSYSRTGGKLSLIMFDIDGFKSINDTYGHHIGDEVLRTVAACVRKILRRRTDMLIRLGGDEFLLTLVNVGASARKDAPAEASAEGFANDLLKLVRETDIPTSSDGGDPIRVTFSAGIAGRNGRESIQAVVKRADAAMYEAKARGRNRVVRSE